MFHATDIELFALNFSFYKGKEFLYLPYKAARDLFEFAGKVINPFSFQLKAINIPEYMPE